MAMKNNRDLRIIKNTSWIIGCHFVQAAVNLLISMITARYLGPSNYGLINYAMSITAFFSPIVHLGINDILVNELIGSSHHNDELLGTATGMTLVSSALCVLGIVAFVCVNDAGEIETLIVSILYSVSLITESLMLIQYWFQSQYLSKYTSVVTLIVYVLVSVYKVMLLVNGKSVYWFAITNALQNSIVAAVLHMIYRKTTGEKLRFSYSAAKTLWKKGKHYILPSMMVSVYAQTDHIMIKSLLGEAELGYYTAALTIAGMTGFVFSAIITSMRPAILEGKAKKSQTYEAYLKKLYCIIIWLALFQSIFISVFKEYIVSIMYGATYAPTVEILSIVTWYSAFSYIGSVRGIWILAENLQKYLNLMYMLGAILNVCLNALWIPKYGTYGAGFATLITQVFTNFVLGFVFKPIRKNNKLMLQSLNPLVLLR